MLPEHFAFMRAVIQGMDAIESWNRYLRAQYEQQLSMQQVQSVIERIRSTLIAQAKRHQRPGTARLLQLTAQAPKNRQDHLPVLADFVATNELDGFLETEQLRLYRLQYGKLETRPRRQGRFLLRQLDALHWLQQLPFDYPRLTDPITDWIEPHLSRQFTKAGLASIQQLIEHVNRIGDRWWVTIPAIGSIKAARIVKWLGIHDAQFGYLLETHVNHISLKRTINERRQGMSLKNAIVPLEKFCFSNRLKKQRTEPCALTIPPVDQLSTTVELQALRLWLHSKRSNRRLNASLTQTLPAGGLDSAAKQCEPFVPTWEILNALSHTQRAYWKEAERFVLWLALDRGSSLSKCSTHDCLQYVNFLERPSAYWCNTRGHDKSHPSWRPFEGSLSPHSRHFAVRVLKMMFNFLVEKQYLRSSPWENLLMKPTALANIETNKKIGPRPSQAARHAGFDKMARQFIEKQLHGLPENSANDRLKCAIWLFQGTGLRIGQVVSLTVDQLQFIPGADIEWQLKIADSAGRVSMLSLSPDLIARLSHYFVRRDLEADLKASSNQGARLLGRAVDATQRAPWAPCARETIDIRAGVNRGTLHDQIKLFFGQCEQACIADPEMRLQFSKATSYWLRKPGQENRRTLQAITS